jgi:hypothetical protein
MHRKWKISNLKFQILKFQIQDRAPQQKTALEELGELPVSRVPPPR